jgi:glycolate oxidase FAD binding subunit
MTATGHLAARLAEAIGPQSVLDEPEELESYSLESLIPSVIARPASVHEAAEVVRFALAEKLALLPLGSRSKHELGMSPDRYDIALDMTALNEIAHFDPGDLTLSVDAGMSLRDLEIRLKEKGQFLPLAVPCFETATVGGTVATGADSALRMQYGSARDFLIGAEFIDGTGQLCKSGGRVVKNVTGYDLHKLLVGSHGTLGVITRLNFRTFPLPPSFGGHLAVFETLQPALEYRVAIEQSGLPLANIEMFSSSTAEMIRAILQRSSEKFPPELSEKGWFVYSSFEGNPEVVQRIGRELQNSSSLSAMQNRILETGEDEALGGMLRESFEWLRWGSPFTLICRLALPSVRALASIAQPTEEEKLRSSLLLRGCGIAYLSVFAENENEQTLQSLSKIANTVNAIARSENGHCNILHAPLTIKREMSGRILLQNEVALQKRVKQAFDPANIFAPGRVVGGL